MVYMLMTIIYIAPKAVFRGQQSFPSLYQALLVLFMDNYDPNGFHLMINRLTFLKRLKESGFEILNKFWTCFGKTDLQLIIPKKITEIGMHNITNL